MNTPDAFWTRVDTTAGDDACWPWLGGHNRSGYGFIKWAGRVRYAHRVAYELHHQCELPAATILLHACDNPSCVNPAHLLPGTHVQNRADCVAKGRHAYGERSGRAKLTAAQVLQIRTWWSRGLITQGDAARLFGITKRAVRFIVKGQHWTHLPAATSRPEAA